MASDPICFTWCPDGEHILATIHVPGCMLTVGTSFGIMPALSQQPFSNGLFLARTMIRQAVPSEVPNEEPKFATFNRLSAARNKPVTNFKLSEKKPPQNKKSQSAAIIKSSS